MDEKTIRYIDMFSGIGGFREGFTRAGGFQCVGCLSAFASISKTSFETARHLKSSTGALVPSEPMHCEIDKHADRSYRALFDTKGEWFCEDARKADPDTMPKFDLLCGGFPCQSFSVAGNRGGFEDARGTLFFELPFA